MEVAESSSDLAGEELDRGLGETFVGEEVVVHVAAADVLEEEVDAVLVLEHVVHAQHKRMSRLEQYLLLVPSVLDLVLINQHIFVDPFHSICFAVVLVHHQEHFAERALVDHLLDLEVFQQVLLLVVALVEHCHQF